MKFTSGLPLSAKERCRCIARQHKAVEKKLKRDAACPSGQRYDKPLTREAKRLTARQIGEPEK